MKKIIKKTVILLIAFIFILITSNVVNAEGTGSLTIKISPDASEAIENKKVYVYLSLTNFNNVETNEPMALTGVLSYDKDIFENVTVEGLNNWIAGYNPENGNLTLDTSSIKENSNIAKITLDVKDTSKSFTSDIKVNNITLTNGENVDMTDLNLNARVSITVNDGDDNNPEPNNPEDDNNQDESAGNNDNNNESDNEQNSSEDVNNDNNENDNNNGENNQNNNQNGNVNNNNNNNQNGEQNNNKEPDKIEKVEDLTTSKDPLPQTGVNYTIVGVIISVFILGVLAFIGFKRLEK